MDTGLNGKSVLVTGGASNIGRAIALAFVAEGANVTLGDLDVENAERVAATAAQSGSGHIEVVRTDVTNRDDVGQFVQSARRMFGGIDVLVNGVGWDDLKYFGQTTPELWEKIISVNLMSVINCTRAVLDTMVEQGHGSIVSISSDASRQGEPREAVYGAAKAGVNAFMKTIAKEFGRSGIRCNVVCPGVTLPERAEELGANSLWVDREAIFTDQQLVQVARALPLRKLGRPQDVANAVIFFASQSLAGHVTGQVLSVSGGYSMVG